MDWVKGQCGLGKWTVWMGKGTVWPRQRDSVA